MDRDDLPREWAFIEMVSVCVCVHARDVLLLLCRILVAEY